MLNFVKTFFLYLYKVFILFFVLDSIYMLYHIYWFAHVEPSLLLWNGTILIMVYDILIFLLAYNMCTERYIVIFIYVLTIYLTDSPLLSFSLIPTPPFLEKFQQISVFYFHKWIQNRSTVFSLSLCPLYCHWKGPILPSCP
jgi:hypothetical protein